MGRWGAVLCTAALVLLGACGGDDESAAGMPGAVGYMPRDSVVLTLPTDLEAEQLRRLPELIAPELRHSGVGTDLREELRRVFDDEEAGISYEDDVEPLLGGDLLLASSPDVQLAALETTDGERLGDLMERLGFTPADTYRDAAMYDAGEGGALAIDGDTVVATLGEDARQWVEQAIDRQRDGGGHDPEALAAALPSVGGEPLLRAAGDAQALIEVAAIGDAASLPWLRAARGVGAAARLEDGALVAAARVTTDAEGLTDEDLPLAPGAESPPAGSVDGAIAAANRDQSQTTVWLARFARAAFPRSRFVQAVEDVEADLGIAFEDEVLAQFNGPSASVATPSGAFAAVSDVADPARMRALLPRLAPRLPPVLRGLDTLGNRGLLTLLLFAPDAPLTPGVLGALQDGIGVRRLEAGAGEQLYRISGLEESGAGFPGPGAVVFGMIGDRFVVATDEQRARAVAAMEVSPVPGAEGTGVARADLSTWSEEALASVLGVRTVPLGEVVGELEASVERVEARLRVAIP